MSNYGRVKSLPRNGTILKERILKQSLNTRKYLIVILCKNNLTNAKQVHRLVAESFINNSENKPVVNHINGIKTDNRVENLEYTTQKDNCKKAWKQGLCETVRQSAYKTKRKSNIKSSRCVAQMHINGTIINVFNSIREAEKYTGINNGNICSCCKGKHQTAGGFMWKYITMQELQAINEKVKELRLDRRRRKNK